MPANGLDDPRRKAARKRRPIAFLDRDGTLVEDHPYQCDPAAMIWMPGAAAAVRLLNDRGWSVGVVTNQSAVARGLCTEAEVRRFHRAMARSLAQTGARIDFFDFCPFHDEATVSRFRFPDHPDRKPNAGMIERALSRRAADRSRSFLIGDRQTDLVAAARAGIAGFLFDGCQPLVDLVEAILATMRTGDETSCRIR